MALVVTMLGGAGLLAGFVGVLDAASYGSGREAHRAVVQGYEEHGYPEKTNDYLRVTFPDSPNGGASAAFRVSRRFRIFRPGETIIVLRYPGNHYGVPDGEFIVKDPYLIWTGPLYLCGTSFITLLLGFTWWWLATPGSSKQAKHDQAGLVRPTPRSNGPRG